MRGSELVEKTAQAIREPDTIYVAMFSTQELDTAKRAVDAVLRHVKEKVDREDMDGLADILEEEGFQVE